MSIGRVEWWMMVKLRRATVRGQGGESSGTSPHKSVLGEGHSSRYGNSRNEEGCGDHPRPHRGT